MTEDWGHVFNGEAKIDYWSPRVAEVLTEQGITKLRIRGWKQPGFEPLIPFREQLVRIYYEIYDDADVPNLAALGQLGRLTNLSLRNGVETIDFSGLQELELLSYSGDTPNFGNVRQARALRTLYIVNGGLRDLTPLAGLDQIAELDVSESKLGTVVGIGQLRALESLVLSQVSLSNLDSIVDAPSLRSLHLFMPRKLQSIAPLTRLPLRVLSIGGTRRISDIERLAEVVGLETLDFENVAMTSFSFLSRLTRLKALNLNGVGKVPSLSFLRPLEALERFFVVDATVEDGDMAVLFELPALKRVFLQKRRHYTHDGHDVQATLTDKWTRGPGAFDNASADEWIAELRQRQPIAWLGNTVRNVLDYGAEKDVPALVGQFAIAAAELIARLRGHGDGTSGPEPITRWLEQRTLEVPPAIVTNAQAALDRLLMEPSGLLRLWEARGQGDAWKAAVADLKRRVAWEPGT